MIRIAARLEHWVAENAKTARAFLKRVDAVVPLARPLQALVDRRTAAPAEGRAGCRAAATSTLCWRLPWPGTTSA